MLELQQEHWKVQLLYLESMEQLVPSLSIATSIIRTGVKGAIGAITALKRSMVSIKLVVAITATTIVKGANRTLTIICVEELVCVITAAYRCLVIKELVTPLLLSQVSFCTAYQLL